MEKYKYGFVILNYNTFEDTVDCVNSIKKLEDYDNCEIIIVDNNSTDNSGNLLKKKYEKNEKITILFNKTNLGFSKGNNVGIRYAVEKLKCDFIIMTNSDTVILQKNFCKLLKSEYELGNYAIIGPEINNPDGGKQLPVYPNIDIKKLKKELLSLRLHYYFNKIYLDRIYIELLKVIKRIKNVKYEAFKNEKTENVIIHGSCIIFTPKYFEGELIGIPEKTKFYCEEQFIYLYSQKNNLKIVYDPEIKILHKINTSTKITYNTNRKRMNFKYYNRYLATKELINYICDLKDMKGNII